MKLVFDVTQEEVDVIQKAHVDYETYEDNVRFCLTSGEGTLNKDILKQYHELETEAKLAFERAKKDIEKKYVPAQLLGQHEYDWTVDYNTKKFILTVKCDCGKQIIRDLGLDLVYEVDDDKTGKEA